MAQTRTYQVTERGGSTNGTITLSVSAEESIVSEVSVPPATVDKQINIAFAYAAVKAVHVSATGPADGTTITINTNSAGTPGAAGDALTFVLPGGIFYATDANNGAVGANPFTVDVASRIYVSNPSTTTAAAFRISLLVDPTP